MKRLSEERVNQIQNRLEADRNRLREEIRQELLRSDQEQYSELAGRVHDAGDESVADLLVDLNVAAVSRSIRELRETEAALQRIAMGSYGLCVECGEEIPAERLDAYPTAARCVVHQEAWERLHAGEGETPRL